MFGAKSANGLQFYLGERLAQPGSTLYYSAMHLPPALRASYLCLYALRDELEGIADRCSDPAVAQSTLAWWHGELQQLLAGEPTHPLSQALAALRPGYAPRPDDLMALVTEGARALQPATFAHFEALVEDRAAAAAPFARLIAQMEPGDGQDHDATMSLYAALALAETLYQLRHHARRGRLFLPQDELAQLPLTAELWSLPQAPAPLGDVVARHAARLQARLGEALGALTRPVSPLTLAAAVRARIDQLGLARIRRDPNALWCGTVEPVPLRKLWIAWRTHRAMGR